MTKKKQKKIKIFNLSLLIILIILIAKIFQIFLIPMVVSMLNLLLALLRIYPLLDLEYKFIGGFFLLFVFWVIFNAICNLTVIIFKYTIKIKIFEDAKNITKPNN